MLGKALVGTVLWNQIEQKPMSTLLLKFCLALFPVLTTVFMICWLLLSGPSTPHPHQEILSPICWETNMDVAMDRAEREQRPLFLHFVVINDSKSQQMEREVFVLPSIADQLNTNFVMVKINASENAVLVQRHAITATPTDLIMKPNGQLIHRRMGIISAERYGEYLAFLQEKILSEEE